MTNVYKFIPGSTKGAGTDPEIRCFSTKREAQSLGNDGGMFTSLDELVNSMAISSTDMVKVYNRLSPKPVNKFESRKIGAARLFTLLESMEPEKLPWSGEGEDTMAKNSTTATATATTDKAAAKAAAKEAAAKAKAEAKAAKEAAAKAKAEEKAAKAKEKAEAKAAAKAAKGDGRVGRTAGLAGSILKATKTENPRRPGSHGFRSLQLIIDAGEAGITFEDFIKKGGRNKDAKWDIDHGAAVSVAPAKS
jgi:hypothetical protein